MASAGALGLQRIDAQKNLRVLHLVKSFPKMQSGKLSELEWNYCARQARLGYRQNMRLRGKSQIRMKQTAAALWLLCPMLAAPALAYDAAEVINLNNKGVKALNQGQYELAISLFEKALDEDPNYVLAVNNLAIAENNYGLNLRKNPKAALVEFHRALWLNPANETAEQNMRGIIRMLGKNDKSFDDRVELGDEAAKTGDLIGAIVEYVEATGIEADPSVYVKLGDVLHLRGEEDNAIVEYHKAARNGDTAEIETKLGRVYESQDDIANAIAAYGRAVTLNVTYRDAVTGLISAWTKAVTKLPTASENHVGLGQAYQYNGEFVKAKAEYSRALECAPDNKNPVAQRLLEELPKAQQVAELNKHINNGIDLQSKKLFYCAIDEYKQALELDPNKVSIVINIGTAYQAVENFELALKAYRQAQKMDPSNESALLGIKSVTEQMENQIVSKDWKEGSELFKKGDYQAAVDKYREVAKFAPKDPATHYSLGAVYQAMNKLDDAISEFRSALQFDRNNAQFQKALDDAILLKTQPQREPPDQD